MNIEDIKTIGIVGSGTMGRGIAISTSVNGFKSILYDVDNNVLKQAKLLIEKDLLKSVEKKKLTTEKSMEVLDNLSFTESIDDFKKCDFVIEAALENLDLKREIFSKLDDICSANAILSSNTSSLSITTISASVKKNPERVIGMHFFNPPNIMKLVEVVKGEFTSNETAEATIEFAKRIGKVPVTAKDTPAFIVNRIARPFYGEALKILSEGSGDVETIDNVMINCGNFAMGPFELMDLIGIDVNFAVTKSVYEAFFNDPKYRPCFIQERMVNANLLGRKTKRGFYNYEQDKK